MATFEEMQEVALMALRDALSWRDDVWPSSSSQATLADFCASIPGISCNRWQRLVTSIDWTSQDLEGTIPSEIGYLTRLERLKLGNNQLHGSIPSTMSKLTLLQHLELYRNDLTGTLPTLTGMINLKRLLVQSNQLEGTLSESLCRLTSLHGLDLFENLFEGSLPDCFGTMSLATLQIEKTRLTGTLPYSLCESIGLDCAAIACPVYTFEPIQGRQSESMECEPCPTALYLGSTLCPDTVDSPLPSSVPTNTHTQTPFTPAIAMIRTFAPAPTALPTIEPSHSLQTPDPSSWNSGIPTISRHEDLGDFRDTQSPTPLFVSENTLKPRGFPSTTKSMHSAGPNSTNRTLMAAAFLLSAIALLTVVVTRRKHRSWWRVQQREERKEEEPPVSALVITPKFHRPSSMAQQSSHRSVGPEVTEDRAASSVNSSKKDEEDDSLESDSGWNDTESSVDDYSEDGESNKTTPSLYPWSGYFSNPLVPV